jgi:hypothetical protein
MAPDLSYSEDLRSKFQPEHLDDLKKSGLCEKTIVTAELRAIAPAEIIRIIGFCHPGVRSGIAFPYEGTDFQRVKVFPPQVSSDGHKIKYLQAKGSGNHLFFPRGVRFRLSDPRIPLYFIEGEKKALLAAQDGLCAVGLAGIWNWKGAGQPGLIVDFQQISLVDRKVFVVPDSDFTTNENVLSAVYRLSHSLSQIGARVNIVCLK